MSRQLTVFLVLTAVAPLGSAPRLKDAPGGDYFPTTVGDRWEIEMRYADRTDEYTEVVTAVEKKDGVRLVSVGREVNGKVGPQLSQVRVTDKGVFRVSLQGSVYDEPYCILKLPLKAGDSWTAEPVAGGGASSSTLKYKVGKEEVVEVPAGKFRAVRIDCEIHTRGTHDRSVLWYDARVGVVRMEYGDAESGYVRVLKSFKPGGK